MTVRELPSMTTARFGSPRRPLQPAGFPKCADSPRGLRLVVSGLTRGLILVFLMVAFLAVASSHGPTPRVHAQALVKPAPVVAVKPEPQRIQIRLPNGELVVSRLHGRRDNEIAVVLPDGRIGFVDGLTTTEQPFEPDSKEKVRNSLLARPEYARFKSKITDHYVLIYDGSERFAEQSGRLLESLYAGLLKTFRDWGLEVHEAEFPLVAIIHAREEDFRARRDVAPEVQAYYEILSNHIVFYETSVNQASNPEIYAMRQAQTVAHEGAHQILQNLGVQPRLAPWPIWMIEGMAEFCAPTGTKKNSEWAGLGKVNPFHMATIAELNDPANFQVRNVDLRLKSLDHDPNLTWIENIVRKTELNPTEYALAWALTHALVTRKRADFVAYLRELAQFEPLTTKTPDDHWADFTRHFLKPRPEPARLVKEVYLHLARQKYDPIPFFAVSIEHPLPGGRIRRAGLITQSPSMIRQRIAEVSLAFGGQVSYRITRWASRREATFALDRMMLGQ